MVKMKDLLTKNTWLWERAKFMNRRYIMQVGGTTGLTKIIYSIKTIQFHLSFTNAQLLMLY